MIKDQLPYFYLGIGVVNAIFGFYGSKWWFASAVVWFILGVYTLKNN